MDIISRPPYRSRGLPMPASRMLMPRLGPVIPRARSLTSLQRPPNPRYWNVQAYRPRPKRLKQFVKDNHDMSRNLTLSSRLPFTSDMNSIKAALPSISSSQSLPRAPLAPFISPSLTPFVTPQGGTVNRFCKPLNITSENKNSANVGPEQKTTNGTLRSLMNRSRSTEQYYRCKECNIFLSCQNMLDLHYSGAKHARKLKELELANSTGEFTKEFVIKVDEKLFKCELCSVFANSFTHMKSHIDGVKHKTKAQDKHTQRPTSTPFSPPAPNISVAKKNNEETNDTRSSKFYCEVCAITANSQLQFDMHMQSQKHFKKSSYWSSLNSNERHLPYLKNKPLKGSNKL